MDKEVRDRLDQFINDFLNVKEVKQFLLIKEEISHSEELTLLKEKLKLSQKDMALSIGKKDYNEKKDNYFQTKKEYENHPLIVNYNVLLDEVNYLLNELKNKLS